MQLRTRVGSLVIAALLVAAPASAQMVHSVSGGLGVFWPRGFDSRVTGDIWVEDLNPSFNLPDVFLGLAFEIGDFKAANVFGEWAVSFGNHFEFGAGLSYLQPDRAQHLSRRRSTSCPTARSSRSRRISSCACCRSPASSASSRCGPGSIQPYVGGGISAINFRYSEVGEFVDPSDGLVFPRRVTGRAARRSAACSCSACAFRSAATSTGSRRSTATSGASATSPAPSRRSRRRRSTSAAAT